MTNKERRRAFALRLEGRGWAEIGRAMGYCGSTVYEDLLSVIRRAPRQPNICYPALRRYVAEQYGGSVGRFAQECGISASTLYTVLRGKSKPSKQVLDAILSATGLSYEEAFWKEG